jgi:hypothetical protein
MHTLRGAQYSYQRSNFFKCLLIKSNLNNCVHKVLVTNIGLMLLLKVSQNVIDINGYTLNPRL